MKLRQPIWPRFLPLQLVLNFATVGPVGRIRKAPGTWGSVAGLLYFTLFFYDVGWFGTVLFGALGIYLAVAMCGEAEFRLGRRDPGEIVLDEFIAIPFCFIGWPYVAVVLPNWAAPWAVFLAGFALFRLFDIWKPGPIGKLQDLPDGWGVVADDIAAALAACLTLHVLAQVIAMLN
ncbi:phosphatidylglycerophosphatase A family protein [Actomonas aquatica]|uniref:Phosphatidylglycerophosphatase A n=1 Tax=Actomonas aquatica TaxID=2866162 RepID=A0ABZ1CBD7_9BACT|nr:phosphatidylglycerophosphatase A [Opitutus sp. WL0086]WRQ88993.1 phosphatidylglycerophosphatase A [Opitutus sp. WL0086]